MDLDDLTDDQVNILIDSIKRSLDELPRFFPTITLYKVDGDYKIVDEKYEIEYVLHVYRGKHDIHRYSMHIRFKQNNLHLVRLCINANNNHINKSDGTNVGRNHIHIYKRSEPDGLYAYELENHIFEASDELIESFQKFIKFLNIKE